MYTAELTFKIKDSVNQDDLVDLIEEIIGLYMLNGQIYGNEYPIALSKNIKSVFVSIPHKDSLQKKYNSERVAQNLVKLKKEFSCEYNTKILGKDLKGLSICSCAKRKSLILFTSFVRIESPVRCGECFSPVPLYSLPISDEHDFFDISGWESDYQCCDTLQMHCRVGEKYHSMQLSKLNSELNKQGIDICKRLQAKVKIPVYYHLYNENGKNKTCPGCGGEWKLNHPLHEIFDFKCDKCHLLSNIAWNTNAKDKEQ